MAFIEMTYYSTALHTLDVNLLDSYDKINISVRKIREMLNL